MKKGATTNSKPHACTQERRIGCLLGWVVEKNIHSNKNITTAWQPSRHGMHKHFLFKRKNGNVGNQADITEKKATTKQSGGSKAQFMLTKGKTTQTKKPMGRGTEHMQKYHKGLAGQKAACKQRANRRGGVATDHTSP